MKGASAKSRPRLHGAVAQCGPEREFWVSSYSPAKLGGVAAPAAGALCSKPRAERFATIYKVADAPLNRPPLPASPASPPNSDGELQTGYILSPLRGWVIAALLLIFVSAPAFAQSRRLLGGSAGGSKYQFFYDTLLEPSVPEVGNLGGGTIGGEGTIHRLMWDRRQHVYFGYDVSIEPLSEPNTYRMSFGELTLSAKDTYVLGGDPSSWTSLPAPDWGGPAVRTVRAGEVLALDLLTNNTTGQKIVDYVTVQGPSAKPASDPWHANFIYETGAPRDFRAEDAALEIRLPRISVNGDPGNSAMTTGEVMYGAAVWFYLPSHGRFILSLTPHPELGFRPAGEIRGSSLTFTMGNDTFDLVSGGRIAPGSGPFNLYVWNDPAWKPPDGQANAPAWGSADRMDQLIANKNTSEKSND